jgi:hypothetical protein
LAIDQAEAVVPTEEAVAVEVPEVDHPEEGAEEAHLSEGAHLAEEVHLSEEDHPAEEAHLLEEVRPIGEAHLSEAEVHQDNTTVMSKVESARELHRSTMATDKRVNMKHILVVVQEEATRCRTSTERRNLLTQKEITKTI